MWNKFGSEYRVDLIYIGSMNIFINLYNIYWLCVSVQIFQTIFAALGMHLYKYILKTAYTTGI